MKRLQIPQKLVYQKFYVHGIAAVNLSKISSLKNAKKTCKPNNSDLNRDWITQKNVQNYYNEKCTYNVNTHCNLLHKLKVWNCLNFIQKRFFFA